MSFVNFVLSFVMFVLGTVVVLAVMGLVAWVTGLLEALEAGREAQTPSLGSPAPASPVPASSVAAPPPLQEVSAPAVNGNIDPTVVAVITAAVTAALQGRPFRIQNIQMASGPVVVSTSWAQAGRQTIHASHAIERKFR